MMERRIGKGPSAGRWGDLGLRAASAAVLGPVALFCLWYGGPAWAALVALAAVGLGLEWSALCGAPLGRGASGAVPLALAAALLLAGWATILGHPVVAVVVLVVGGGGTGALGRRWAPVWGVAYLGLAVMALAWLRADPVAGRANVLFVLLIVWASDIGAYVAGRLIGGPKLAPRISPAKTWSGAIGGLVAAVAAGGAAVWGLDDGVPWQTIPVAALLSIASQGGDLFESALKRHYGVKDSGRLIPGHGGLFDRLDGLVAAAPMAALLAILLGRGMVLWQ
jgi:phosphatidate cytidylyltransferase